MKHIQGCVETPLPWGTWLDALLGAPVNTALRFPIYKKALQSPFPRLLGRDAVPSMGAAQEHSGKATIRGHILPFFRKGALILWAGPQRSALWGALFQAIGVSRKEMHGTQHRTELCFQAEGGQWLPDLLGPAGECWEAQSTGTSLAESTCCSNSAAWAQGPHQ